MSELENRLKQIDMVEFIKKDFDNKDMFPIHGILLDKNSKISYISYIIPINKIKRTLKTINKDILDEYLSPGFILYGYPNNEKIVYSRFNNDLGAEPLVLQRKYNGLMKDTIEISEEFRLLNNLYYDMQNNIYEDLINKNTVIYTKDNIIYINLCYLKRFLAVKHMVLVLHIESEYSTKKEVIQENNIKSEDYFQYKNDELLYEIAMYNYKEDFKEDSKIRYYKSVFRGKKIIYGCNIEQSGYWPYSNII